MNSSSPGRWMLQYGKTFARHLAGRLGGESSPEEKYDLVFVIWEGWLDWILEARCRHLSKYLPGKVCLHRSLDNIPPSRAYFFADQGFLAMALEKNPHIWGSKILVWFTHPHDLLPVSRAQQVFALKQATKIFINCSQFKQDLQAQGLNSERVEVVGPRADREVFLPHRRSGGAIGFCTRYYERKNPDLIFTIVRNMPDRRFILVGPDWDKYARFQELSALPNLTYVQPPYGEYPKYYAEMDVFVSPAFMEGGPVPLIESMMCNIVPVASRVGFAVDIVKHGENGFLFEPGAPFEQVCPLIEQAFQLNTDIRRTVEHLTWEAFAERLRSVL